MKTLALIFSMMTLITFNSLGQKTDIKGLLEKPETRTEIFNTIMNSHELMTDFMKAANGNEHAMMMMQQNNQSMQHKENMNNGNMMNDNGNSGMNNDQHMMNNDQMMNNQHQVMGMMMNEPSMMPGIMNNMMDYGQKDSTMYNQMIHVMAMHPQMLQMASQKMRQKETMDANDHSEMMNSENKKK